MSSRPCWLKSLEEVQSLPTDQLLLLLWLSLNEGWFQFELDLGTHLISTYVSA